MCAPVCCSLAWPTTAARCLSFQAIFALVRSLAVGASLACMALAGAPHWLERALRCARSWCLLSPACRPCPCLPARPLHLPHPCPHPSGGAAETVPAAEMILALLRICCWPPHPCPLPPASCPVLEGQNRCD